MPSSTSNSDHRLPTGPWGRTWLTAAGICVIALLGYEMTWRAFGFTPSIRDDPGAWAVARGDVRESSTVLVGSSRIQADVDPAVWGVVWAPTPVQLAIVGGSPVPVLEELAADASFRGTVIMDALPRIIFDAEGARERLVLRWLSEYRQLAQSPARLMESELRVRLTGRLVSPRLPPWEFFRRSFLRTDPARIPYVTMEDDRFMQLDFARVDAEVRVQVIHRQIREQGEPERGEEIASTIRRIDAAVRAIQRRGGAVMLVHFPHDKAVREIEDELYPRARYWDAMVSGVDAPAVHYRDEPALAHYSCPDGSHIDVRDTPAFTRSLALIARDRIAAHRPSTEASR